jgi:uroporphyrinogen decarboxylase
MTSKQRMLTAIEGGIPDRLPATTHHVMQYFLDKYMNGISRQEFFDYFGLDPITWNVIYKPDQSKNEFYEPEDTNEFLQSRMIFSDNWRIEKDNVPDPQFKTIRYNFITPDGNLSTILQSNDQTSWVTEHLIKEKSDIDIIAKNVTYPLVDIEAINKIAKDFGERGMVRGHIPCFDVFGQPGCWQDACCLYGTEKMIMAAFDDPNWVKEFLTILQKRKLHFIKSLQGAQYDLLELGGGDASTTVISPKIFNEFVAPFDSKLIDEAHEAGQRIVYHTCGGMMPVLEDIAAMNPDAMETFTPPEMGGDVDLAEAKKRIGDKVCMIGGFDQFHYFKDCTPEDTKKYVRKCFNEAGAGGGFIICPSDHFFDADIELVKAYADEAQNCIY